MHKKISGWGRYPVIDTEVESLYSVSEDNFSDLNIEQAVARGLGRSYGDSALASKVIDVKPLNRMLSFNQTTGELRCEAGVILADILEIFLNEGWFLPVTPGTKYITVGGAIASDVHGKNHHSAGCFSEYVSGFKLLGAQGNVYHCSRKENVELFRATCGGMGLTGIILEVTFKLKKVKSSYFDVRILKARNLSHIFELFKSHKNWPYSVAWIDCLASGNKLGRSLLFAGRNSANGKFDYTPSDKLNVPFNFPGGLLNKYTVSLFNTLYFNRIWDRRKKAVQGVDSFFYPLDAIRNWNRIYGDNGFLQYQFILPKKVSYEGLEIILEKISEAGKGSFLSVLKLMGPENNNYLSFPMEGYTLALDFNIEPGIFELLDELDQIVIEHGGRLYLTKDARMNPAVFEQSYPKLDVFRNVRDRYGLKGIFESEQSKRLGI